MKQNSLSKRMQTTRSLPFANLKGNCHDHLQKEIALTQSLTHKIQLFLLLLMLLLLTVAVTRAPKTWTRFASNAIIQQQQQLAMK
jgi:hypothetical protein